MKNYKKLILALSLTILFQFIVFSQSPGDFGDEEDINPTDTPININLWVLVVLAISIGFYKARKEYQKSKL